ncbi:Negative regulator of sexual conjugation and meiosis [Fulvia fulva]|uniref:Negative regulator of sexual conjugation and meiosis n=1 Tax=Passalora fulva TaxID=5499 RepID=A0A9Q8PCF2_PASFU|nr:Negative regulator of sexual conjugation and meiosis [Fulvia fulva]KAK4619612.1 Negative regulator of sexual conjugation and meiosis [Fulvia fulva]KAK4621025.1 Negative regulator of sexual conjugation and meiosis [Fulvia fulva]UJO19979.1 Negative regulator of sexual conjugation and meiosis [Fulvia fulva]WPV17531.1 Negative regulator of sexual conjugation and meiosis [Fulvia fulva]WPV32680.1 Negative regulator of sexual conjugation and meiosis [Fulvia fulva]
MLPTPPASPKPSGECSPEDNIGLVLAGRIELTGILGVGAYGTVYKAHDLVDGSEYAVKALSKVGLDPRQKKFQDREIHLHYLASQHPNVVSLVKILDSADCTYVVMEYCPEGDLFSKITEEGHYIGDDFKAKQVFLQILSAVQHCHSRGIFHRDLKPENVLVKDQGRTVKLADFGLATQDRVTSDFGCGSTFYMSPECQNPNPKPYSCYASAPNDVWSLGVILVNLTCGRNPWKRASVEDSTFRAYMRDRNFLQSILPITNEFNHILQRIFEVNPRNRITLGELRDLIFRCPRLTTNGSSNPVSAPATPPYSPVEQAMDSVTDSSGFEVPRLELPAQQYPPSPAYFYPSPESTPPTSGHCTPQPTIYTAPPKSMAPVISTGHFFSNFQRCGQMFSNFNIQAPNHMWAATH